ncbi:hypothetical protein HY988_02005 [Candidatus Micrarchaeota archaeon]|nr:hypothetical protein [Candidatus Micrarchaeota archaeon]
MTTARSTKFEVKGLRMVLVPPPKVRPRPPVLHPVLDLLPEPAIPERVTSPIVEALPSSIRTQFDFLVQVLADHLTANHGPAPIAVQKLYSEPEVIFIIHAAVLAVCADSNDKTAREFIIRNAYSQGALNDAFVRLIRLGKITADGVAPFISLARECNPEETSPLPKAAPQLTERQAELIRSAETILSGPLGPVMKRKRFRINYPDLHADLEKENLLGRLRFPTHSNWDSAEPEVLVHLAQNLIALYGCRTVRDLNRVDHGLKNQLYSRTNPAGEKLIDVVFPDKQRSGPAGSWSTERSGAPAPIFEPLPMAQQIRIFRAIANDAETGGEVKEGHMYGLIAFFCFRLDQEAPAIEPKKRGIGDARSELHTFFGKVFEDDAAKSRVARGIFTDCWNKLVKEGIILVHDGGNTVSLKIPEGEFENSSMQEVVKSIFARKNDILSASTVE